MIVILNCDFDEDPETNGAQLVRKQLMRAGIKNMSITNAYAGEIPDLGSAQGVIITGSRASVYENNLWIQQLSKTLRAIDQLSIPTLGVCFGFQLVAQTFGGIVQSSGSFWEGFLPVNVDTTHPLFEGCPAVLTAYHSHGDVAKALPTGAVVFGSSPHSIQAFEFRKFWCVQFHPEITAEVAMLMAERDGRDVRQTLHGVPENYDLPSRVIQNFCRHASII